MIEGFKGLTLAPNHLRTQS